MDTASSVNAVLCITNTGRASLSLACQSQHLAGWSNRSERHGRKCAKKAGKAGQEQEQEGVKEKKAPLKWDGSSKHKPLEHLQPL